MREFPGCRFAEQDAARVAQFRGDDCVFRRDMVSQQLGLSSGSNARSLDDVLQTVGYAVQRAA